MQAGVQLLRGLKMDGGKAQFVCLVDIRQGIINKQTFMGGFSNFFKHDLEDLRVWLYVPYIARYDEVIEQIKEIIFFASQRKCLR